MIKNYIITAWRNLVKHKFFSFINVFGLAVGLACCLFIISYIYQELNYDRYPVNSGQIYRVGVKTVENGGFTEFPMVDDAVGQGIKASFPQVLESARLEQFNAQFISFEDKKFKEQRMAIIDSNFLQLFSIPLIQGDVRTALNQPNTMVVNRDFARRYFGNASPIGKTVTMLNGRLVKVTGLIDKVPDESHFHFDAFVSRVTFSRAHESWSNVGNFTYLLLRKNTDAKKLEAALPQLVNKFVVPEIQHDMGVSLAEAQKSANNFIFYLQPLSSIHLHSATKYEMEPNGDIHYVYIFGALAFFILMLACINFTNLSTASSTGRSKEIGIRKVMGSSKNALIGQFLTESVMLSLLALCFALAFIYVLLPYFNELSGKNLNMSFFLSARCLIVEIVLAVLVGLFAGTYPAFFLSSFNIISVLKGSINAKPANKNQVRSGLIVFQFAVSTSLIIATIVVYQQLHFMQNKKIGYDKEHVLVINDSYLLGNGELAFKQQLLGDNRIASVSISQYNPTNGNLDGTQIYAKDIADNGSRNEIHTNIYHIDSEFIPTLSMEMATGRNFSPAYPSDSSAVVINEAAVNQLGWGRTDPLGKFIVRSGNKQFKVIGVVKDFNYASAKQKVAPLVMMLGNNRGGLIIKTKPGTNIASLLSDTKQMWRGFNANGPFNYTFLDESYQKLYIAEERTGGIFVSFAVIALIIGSMGLFGIAAFTIRQRVKEIGIRKVLGASSATISAMLSTEFLKLVLLAIGISFPITWFAMNKWLQDFASRITISWNVFVLAAFIALLIAVITISFQALKAALANPVKSLRSE